MRRRSCRECGDEFYSLLVGGKRIWLWGFEQETKKHWQDRCAPCRQLEADRRRSSDRTGDWERPMQRALARELERRR